MLQSKLGGNLKTMTEGGKRLRLYRHKGLWGGATIGAIVGALGAGPLLSSWADPLSKYAAAISLLSGVGAVVGYFFYEIYIAHVAAGGSADPMFSGREHTHSDFSGNDSGDGD
jgi:hypothetical protein